MIVVLAGTRDGRELAQELSDQGYEVLLSVVSSYGAELVQAAQLPVRTGALDEAGLKQLLLDQAVSVVVDASHPYAANVSANAIAACRQSRIPYIRYERPQAQLPLYKRLHTTATAGEAARAAAALGQVVFLTTGSRTLETFTTESALQRHRIIARVLPDPAVISQCLELGLQPRDIVAMEVPFSHEMNVAMFRHYQSEVIVTKDSGQAGGTDTKITAAIELNLPLIIITRPTVSYGVAGHSTEQIIQYIQEVYNV